MRYLFHPESEMLANQILDACLETNFLLSKLSLKSSEEGTHSPPSPLNEPVVVRNVSLVNAEVSI